MCTSLYPRVCILRLRNKIETCALLYLFCTCALPIGPGLNRADQAEQNNIKISLLGSILLIFRMGTCIHTSEGVPGLLGHAAPIQPAGPANPAINFVDFGILLVLNTKTPSRICICQEHLRVC